MRKTQFISCCFCNQPTTAISPSPVRARFAHPACYVEYVKMNAKPGLTNAASIEQRRLEMPRNCA
jgi:hypothetical protein